MWGWAVGMEGKAAMSRAVVDDDPLALTLGSIYTAAAAAATAPAPPPDTPPPPAPFPWATERPARHDTLESLLRRGITSVEGEARCRRCNARATVAYDLEAKYREVRDYIAANRHALDDRAPEAWMSPALPGCEACGQRGSVWPVIPAEKREINWLFLLLGQLLGCCTLEQLKYFCKNTGIHRTGAKNRVLYCAYMEMCKQLEPQRPFDETVPDGGNNGFLQFV